MATNKTKRSIHLTQPNHSPAELMPVKSHVYHAIAELNTGLEKAIQNLQTLQDNHLFRASGLTAMNRVLRGIRAQANRRLMAVLDERETANAGHYQQLCLEPENR
jgi:D-serine dehydratase